MFSDVNDKSIVFCKQFKDLGWGTWHWLSRWPASWIWHLSGNIHIKLPRFSTRVELLTSKMPNYTPFSWFAFKFTQKALFLAPHSFDLRLVNKVRKFAHLQNYIEPYLHTTWFSPAISNKLPNYFINYT